MKTILLSQRIQWLFGILTALLVIMGALTLLGLQQIQRHASEGLLNGVVPGLRASAQLQQVLAHNHALAEGLATRPDGEADWRRSSEEVRRMLAAYESTGAGTQDRRNSAAVRSALDAYLAVRPANASELDAAYERAETAVAGSSQGQADRARAEVDSLIKEVNRLRWVAGITVAFLVLVVGAATLRLRGSIAGPSAELLSVMERMRQGDFSLRATVFRNDELGRLTEGFNRMADEITGLVGQVQTSGVQVNTSLTEIAATAKQQQATASEIAATTVQIGATSKEISATSRELSRTMGEVFAVAEQTASLAQAGQTRLGDMEDTMQKVMEAAASINAKLAVLNERAGDINQVVTTITKVADQTNLLSLNAAIEAEKAGEYGRGFAVVATEIRRLADQTGVATFDIEQIVHDIQTAISAGVMGMDKFSEEVRQGMRSVEQVGAQLSQIIQQVQALAPEFEAVNDGMQTQAAGAEQISQALVQLTEAAQQTVESLQQSSSAIDDLNHVSGGLRSSIAKFKVAA